MDTLRRQRDHILKCAAVAFRQRLSLAAEHGPVVPFCCSVQCLAEQLQADWSRMVDGLVSRLQSPGVVRFDEMNLPHAVEYARRARGGDLHPLRLVVMTIPRDPVSMTDWMTVARFDVAGLELAS